MRKLFLLIILCLSAGVYAQEKTALLLIDIQDFYFPGGFSALHEPEAAADNAANILNDFREKKMPVIHVQHKTDKQMDIHASVKPLHNEKIFVKTEINAFNGTGLKAYLDSLGIESVVIVGMQTHMCVEAATRAAYDFGYKVILVKDACATQPIAYDGVETPAEMVHNSTLATLPGYAKIVSTEEFLE